MSNIKNWLNDEGFNWEQGKIIHHMTDGSPGWSDATGAVILKNDDPVLVTEFDSGFGGPECPRFIAEDDVAFYFPRQYDGATAIEKIWKDIDKYMDFKGNETPYPGG